MSAKPDLLYAALKAQVGRDGTVPDLWHAYLRGLGYSGAFHDMAAKHAADLGVSVQAYYNTDGSLFSSGPPTYIGGTFAVTQSSATPTLAVPGGATSGDLVIAILRARADRTMSGFTGWTQLHDAVVQSDQNPLDPLNSRVYILHRNLTNETSFAFTHSAAAAYGGALLVFRNSSVIQDTLSDSYVTSITKAGSNSLLLAVGLANNDLNNPSTAANPTFTDYTRAGVTYFDNASTFFYTAYCETRSGVPAGSTGVTDVFPSAGNQNGVWLAEIG